MLTEGGDWDKLGRGCLWNGEIQNCIHQNHIFRVRVVDQSVLPEFLSAVVGSPAGKSYFQGASKQTTNLASINQRQLRAFPVPVLPIAEQRAIVAELNDVAACVARLRHEQDDTGLERVVPRLWTRLSGGTCRRRADAGGAGSRCGAAPDRVWQVGGVCGPSLLLRHRRGGPC